MSEELARTYNRIADDWHKDHEDDDWWVEETDKLLGRLATGSSILDVGCGSGVKSKYFTERGFAVIGIDISTGLLAIAKRIAPKGEYRVLSMEELGTIPETFDLVFAQASLLHIPRDRAGEVVRKMAKRAKLSGFVYIAVKEAKTDCPNEEVLRESDYGYDYERFFTYFTQEEIENYMTDAGLTIVSSARSGTGKTVWIQVVGQKAL
jgi:SAM-dependent methyltransferase